VDTKKTGFTLIEVIVVILILTTLSTLIIFAYMTSLKRGRDSTRKSDIRNISTALELYYEDIGRYPIASAFSLGNILCNESEGCTQVYMQKVPKDPLSKKSYYYETDQDGTYFVLYSGLEIPDDKGDGVNQDGYLGSCSPSPCKFGVGSTNADLVTLAEASNAPATPPGQLKKEATPTPTATPIPTLTPTSSLTPTIGIPQITVAPTPGDLNNFEIKYEGLSSNTYYPMFKYQTLDVRCPKGYGVRDIQVKSKDISRKDVKFMGCSLNSWSYRNDLGAACAFAADSPFDGQMSIVCDREYFNISLYKQSQVSDQNASSLPDMFYLGDFTPQLTKSSNGQQQELSVTCPAGYKATDITCTTHFINYTWLNYFYQIEGLVSMQVDSVRTATCKYDAKNSFFAWITTVCKRR
jgi:general secretion pathway protein G